MSTKSDSNLVTPHVAAEELGIAEQTLANWRWQGTGPKFVKTSPGKGGKVLYRRRDIEAWLDRRTVQTSPG
jgi:predicted DNA-binding transcriptional regulator AlpA